MNNDTVKVTIELEAVVKMVPEAPGLAPVVRITLPSGNSFVVPDSAIVSIENV